MLEPRQHSWPVTRSGAHPSLPHLVCRFAHPSARPALSQVPSPGPQPVGLCPSPCTPSPGRSVTTGHTSPLPPHLPHLSPELDRFLGPSTVLSSPHPPALSIQEGASHLRPCWAPGGVDLYCSPGCSPLTSFLDLCGLLSGPQPRSQAEREAVSPGLWPPRKGSLGLKVEGAGPADPGGEGEGGGWPGAGTTGVLFTKCPSLDRKSTRLNSSH